MKKSNTRSTAIERAIDRQTRALLILVSALPLTEEQRQEGRQLARELDGEETQLRRTARMAACLLRV